MMVSRQFMLAGLVSLIAATDASAQAKRTLAERLGYPRTAKLLIVTSDDLGMTHSVDSASIGALESGAITSGSVMVPCKWFGEMAAYAHGHPNADLGLHLTLTDEWKTDRWIPLLPRDRVPSLFDSAGALYRNETQAAAHIDPREVEAELRAQIDSARAVGLHLSHLDSHIGLLYQNRALFAVALKLAREYKIPLRMWREQTDFLDDLLKPGDIVLDHHVTIDASIPPAKWAAFYSHAIANLKPGVTEMNVHLAFDDEEMRGETVGHSAWGAAWRQRDVDFIMSDAFRTLLKENGVTLVGWHDVANLMVKAR